MEQTTLYDFLGVDQDPLLQKIKKMDKGQEVKVGEVQIRLNPVGLFELITDETEECCSDAFGCYQKIKSLLFSKE